MKKIFQTRTKIIKNERVARRYFKLNVSCATVSSFAKPGQFVEVKINALEPLLRRPFSIHRINGKNVEILYEVVGQGTEILSLKKAGEYLDIIGPLGNGFTLNIKHSTLNILVAGGMGVAPLLFLAEKMVASHKSQVTSKPLVLLGAKTKRQILCENEFKRLGCDVKIATDDGSRGFKGKATVLLKHLLSTIDYRPSTIYSCGPRPMLKAIAELCKINKIPAQISLEEHMACGIGACLGCVVRTKEGYKRVCKEGPVFDSHEIIWSV